jgi:hypothetical protein
MLLVGKWIKLEIIMLSKISQTQKNTTYFLSYIKSRSNRKGNEQERVLLEGEPVGGGREKMEENERM